MKKYINNIICIIFVVFICGFGFFNLFNEERAFSNNENRSLQLLPEFSFDSLFSGEYIGKFEKWIQDQFIFRDDWITLKAIGNLSLAKIENNNVFLAKDDYLIDQFILNDETIALRNIKKLNEFKHDVNLMLVPTSAEVNQQLLPRFSYNTSQKKVINNLANKLNDNVNYISIYDELLNSEDTFFKNDHHWNLNGAYIGYQKYMQSLGIKPNEYTFSKVSDDFKGTMYSKAGLFFKDGEDVYTVNELLDLNVEVVYDLDKTSDSLFASNNLNVKDQYTYYLDGNHSIVNIDNKDNSSNKNLLVIKDSYAHILVPMLVPHYDTVTMIDMRYYKANVSEYIEQNNINEILILYSVGNFTTDTNLIFLK